MSFNKTAKRFITSHKNHTKRALEVSMLGIDHMLDHKDWDGLAIVIAGVEPKMAQQIKQIIGACVGGVAVAKDNKHHTGMRFKLGDNFGPTESLDVLRDLVAAGETIYGDKVNALIGKDKPEPAKKSAKDLAAQMRRAADKNGVSISDLIKALETVA
mgnify:CR=1 FL=1|tara:strand:+ start:37784 stop:38254 length:471 start_codon:yes stop_codon:yes gene_type:complete